MTGMVGRVYRWRGETWRVLARWRTPEGHERWGVCPGCGLLLGPTGPIFCHCVPMPDAVYFNSAPRNVLLENVTTGRRTVRPFRGLRRAAA